MNINNINNINKQILCQLKNLNLGFDWILIHRDLYNQYWVLWETQVEVSSEDLTSALWPVPNDIQMTDTYLDGLVFNKTIQIVLTFNPSQVELKEVWDGFCSFIFTDSTDTKEYPFREICKGIYVPGDCNCNSKELQSIILTPNREIYNLSHNLREIIDLPTQPRLCGLQTTPEPMNITPKSKTTPAPTTLQKIYVGRKKNGQPILKFVDVKGNSTLIDRMPKLKAICSVRKGVNPHIIIAVKRSIPVDTLLHMHQTLRDKGLIPIWYAKAKVYQQIKTLATTHGCNLKEVK